jgi:hypothetical protein
VQQLYQAGWQALLAASVAQGEHIQSEEPAARFLSLVGAAITSGEAHLAHAETGGEPVEAQQWGWREKTIGIGIHERVELQPQGRLTGWLAGNEVWLEPETTYALAQQFAQKQNTGLNLTQRTLWKRLAEKNLILTEPDSRGWLCQTVRRTVNGQRRRVVALKTQEYLISQNTSNTSFTSRSNSDGRSRAQNVDVNDSEHVQRGRETRPDQQDFNFSVESGEF